ncbi:hypothetical protein [Halalkalibacter oceani]|uniref:hypothetical protein n=1 Tax=Halalkalibacter oceani TaxID=1653776 RepID=UPI003399556D
MKDRLLPLNLQFFADGEEQGDQQAETQAGGDTQQQDQSGDQSGTGDQQTSDEKTFTQEDVNNLIAKETRKQQEKLLKQLGIENFDNAKEGMKQFKEWQESQKTEQQKQAERLKELETNYTTTAEENADLKAQISAMKAGVLSESVEDVVTLAKRMVNDDMDMDAAIAKVVEKYPHFAGQQEKKEEVEKPSFSTGEHKKQPQSLADQWAEAFK